MDNGIMREISLIYKRFSHKISRIEQQLIFENSDMMITKHRVKISTPFIINGDVVLDDGYWALWFTFWGKWHDIGKFYPPEEKFTGYYCDIITPMRRLSDSEIEITDLCLDLWISPDGNYTILDEDEFDEAVRSNWIDNSLIQRAKSELATLIESVKLGEFPPDFVKSYELLLQNRREERKTGKTGKKLLTSRLPYFPSFKEVRPMAATNDSMRIFSGRAHPELAKEIASILDVPLGEVKISTFPNTETHVQIEESMRGCDIYIIQPTSAPANENLMELLIMIDAFRRASAKQINAVVPYYGYARQDHKSTGREPISARLVADLLTVAGADRVVSVDLHATQIQGFFHIPMDHLTAAPILSNYFKERKLENPVLVAPDVGRAKLVDKYVRIMDMPLVVMHKRRSGVGGINVEVVEVIGDVSGKTPILIDDEIASGSIIGQVKALVNKGANKAYIAATHPIFVGKFLERLSDPDVEEVVVTNTVPVPLEKRIPKITILSIAPLLAEVISRIHNNLSVSRVFSKHHIDFAV
jgi:ribose-phosphate pyrophosphokinase